MHETEMALAIHNRVHRHAPQFEQVDFLLVQFGDMMFWVGQAHKWNPVLMPVLCKWLEFVRPDSQDLGSPRSELGVAISQARQLRAAIRSLETAQESQYNHLLTAV